MRDVTVVLAHPTGDAVDGVRDTLSGWAGAGLVRPFLWWHGRADAGGHLVRPDGRDGALPLLEAISGGDYQTVRLVSLVLAGSVDDVLDLDVRKYTEDVEEVIADRLGANQRFARVNLIVPASGVHGLPVALLLSHWDLNLVAADEDRQTPTQASTHISHPGRLVPHAAGVLASVAGLWRGLSAAPLDDLREGGQQDARLRVVRSYVRALRCPGLIEGVTRQILDLQANGQWLADAVDAAPAGEPEQIVSVAAEEFLAGPGARLTRQPVRLAPAPGPRVLTPLGAFLELWRFVADLGRRTPFEIRDYGKDKVQQRFERFAQQVTFGEDSAAVVKIGTRTLAAERDAGERISTGAADFADALLEWIGSSPPVAALGEEWRGLRALAFGLVDGGDLPPGVRQPQERTRRLVVLDPHQICPDPLEAPFELPNPPADPVPDPVPDPLAPCDPAAAATARALSPDTPEQERFQRWLDRRRGSLLWRVGERIAADGAAAEAALVDALRLLRRPRDDHAADRRETSRMYRRLMLIVASALGVVALGIVLAVRSVVPLRSGALVAAVAVAAGVIGMWSVFYRYARRQFRIANARLARLEEDRRACRIAEHESAELVRLSAAYSEFLDWSVIIGSVLHRPGGEPPAEVDGPDPAELGLPDAVAVAVAETGPRQRRRLAAIVGRRHFHRGWASGLLGELTARSMADLKFEKGLSEDAADPEPEIDRQAREWLRRDLMGGTAQIFGLRIRDDVVRHVGRLPVPELVSALRPPREPNAAGRDTGFHELDRSAVLARSNSAGVDFAASETPETFLAAILSQLQPRESFSSRMWRLGRGPAGDDIGVWLPASMPAPAGPVSGRIHRSDVGDGSTAVLWTIRLDLSGPRLWSDLSIFVEEPPEQGGPERPQNVHDDVG